MTLQNVQGILVSGVVAFISITLVEAAASSGHLSCIGSGLFIKVQGCPPPIVVELVASELDGMSAIVQLVSAL